MTSDMDYDENSHKVAAERELQIFNGVVEQYATALQQLQVKALQQCNTTGQSLLQPAQPHQTPPVQIKLSPYEPEGVYHVCCDIEAVNKVVLALTAICEEVKLLVAEVEADLLPPIILYGQEVSGEESSGEPQLCLSRMLATLSRLQCWVARTVAVTGNLLQQLAALHQPPAAPIISTKDVHLQVVWEHLGRLLATTALLDLAVTNNGTLQQHWGAYKRLVRTAPDMLPQGDAVESPEVQLDRNSLRPLTEMLQEIEKNVLQGNIFKTVCRSGGVEAVARNMPLRDELLTVTLGWCAQLESQCSEQWWSDVQQDVVAVTCLYLLHHIIYEPSPNKRAVKLLSQLYKKVPCVTLCFALVWQSERFILTSCPALGSVWDNKTCEVLKTHRQQHLASLVAGLAKQAQTTKTQVGAWSVEMAAAATKPASQFNRQDLTQRTALFMQGVMLAVSAKYTVSSVLNLHVSLGRPLGRACVLNVCVLLESVYAVHTVYATHAGQMLPQTTPLMAQFVVAQLLAAVKQAKLKVGGSRQRAGPLMDVLGCLSVVERCLGCAAPTSANTTTARIALSLANQRDTFKDEELPHLVLLLRRLEFCSELQTRLTAATSLGPLLHQHRVIVETFLGSVATAGPAPVSALQAVLWCAAHCRPWLLKARHLPSPDKLLHHSQQTLCRLLHDRVVTAVCSAVETELRLSTHNHLQLHPRNPFQEAPAPPTGGAAGGTTGTTAAPVLLDPLPFLALPPINCLGKVIDIKGCVEQYLSRTFYALTVVAPHDCHTYQEMRALAAHKWNLHTHNTHLPAHTTHQGVDALEVVRQLSVFVRGYHYSLSQQVFVEAESSSKHLNTLSITHIANSIRTHGPGIINSTVNFTYQFLVSKFKVFSQFLYDEHIKSRLVKDRKHWKEVRTAEEKWFPFERAEKFNLGIRKLGINSQGLSYLDQFRGLVTQMGNAMGYVRLVRSGGLRCSSNTVRFLPDLSQLKPFAELCRQRDAATGAGDLQTEESEGKTVVSEQTMTAARNLDTVIQNLQQSFQEDTDFFKILVEVFSSALAGDASSHLRNFYLIVPALTLNFVHHAIVAKDLLNKKNKTGAAFTMDGFAMGVAYLLSVLGQGPVFDSLHWWSGVRRYFITQTEKVEKQRSECMSSGDQKLAETLSLTLARLHQHQQEYELLYLTLTSARGFFRGANRTKDDEGAGDKETKGDKDSIKSGDSGRTEKDGIKNEEV